MTPAHVQQADTTLTCRVVPRDRWLHPFSSHAVTAPDAPVGPLTPVAPLTPVGPLTPVAPLTPVVPLTPVGPETPGQRAWSVLCLQTSRIFLSAACCKLSGDRLELG